MTQMNPNIAAFSRANRTAGDHASGDCAAGDRASSSDNRLSHSPPPDSTGFPDPGDSAGFSGPDGSPHPSILEVFAGLLSDSLGLLNACRTHTRDDLIALGVPDTTAQDLAKLADIYFGQTAYNRLQEETISAIRANRHNLATLLVIEKHANTIKPAVDKWKLRHHAARHTGTTSAIKSIARTLARELKGPPKPPEPGCSVIRRKPGDPWTLKLHGSSDQVAEMLQHIDTPEDLIGLIRGHERTATERTKYAFGADAEGTSQTTLDDEAAANTDGAVPTASAGTDGPDCPAPAPEVATQHVTCTECGAATEAKQVVAGLRTNVIITLDQLTEILNDDDGTGDDVLLKMTNGATITGRDLVSRMLADIGLVTLVHPVKGPVNLYRLSRFANTKQRLMAMAENPTCPWDGCYHPADSAQIHHLKAWKYGGHTNPENLTVACPYHNGVNDDDPSTPRRGRLERVNGKVRRIPPWATTYHPAKAAAPH